MAVGMQRRPAPALGDGLARFLHYLEVEKGASVNTIAAYRNDLQQLADFLGGKLGTEASWGAVDRGLVQEFILEMRRRGYTDTSVARKVAAVRSFFAFLVAEGLVRRNPTDGLASPRINKALPRAISPNEVDELLEQPARRHTPEARRDQAMLELLYATGMRVTELVSLDVNDVHLGPAPFVRCRGKGGKERSIPIHEHAAEALRLYLEEARPLLLRHKGENALFLNRRGERLTRQGFWLILKAYAAQAGLGKQVTPHTLRHSFATHMLRGGMPLRDLQELLGHASIATTQVYTHLTRDHLREAYQKAHPRAS
jgi:integrase/recombinase XerD